MMILDGKTEDHTLVICKERAEGATVDSRVWDAETGQTILAGNVSVEANGKAFVSSIPAGTKQRFLVIEWTGSQQGKNHFLDAKMEKIQVDQYIAWLDRSGIYDEWVQKQATWEA